MNQRYVAILERYGLVRNADGLLYIHFDAAFARACKREPDVAITVTPDLVNEIADARIREASDELIDAGASRAEIEELTATYLPPT